eukprot:TRINITY_DN5468_c0_g2_i12.p1 TRINITY_DN5468_c0_g2~~TRINITY_DN5468_c0_g2_i12.p1  ORF type:complete len:292 (-),score=58.07 TRINITY_DN5468_c0_g2_i12:76-951(-)
MTTSNWEHSLDQSKHVPLIIETYLPTKNPPPGLETMQNTLRRYALDLTPELSLARLNVKDQRDLAMDLRVVQIPTTLILYKGKIVQLSVGLLSEKLVYKFLSSTLSSIHATPITQLVEEAEGYLEIGDIDSASRKFNSILEKKIFFSQAIALGGLALCAMKEGNMQVASSMVETVKKEYPDLVQSHPKLKQFLSSVELRLQQEQPGEDVQEIFLKLKENPKDLSALYSVGVYYAQQGKYEESFQHMLEIIKIDKHWREQAAKEFLLKTFESLGDGEIATRGKKRLNSIWFS